MSDPAAGGWRGRRVFITGATGFVGSWLIRDLLALGASITALVRDADPQSELYRSHDIRRIAVVNGVLEDFWTLERAILHNDIDTVFHLGAQAIVGAAYHFPLPTFEANIRGTYHLLEACRLHQVLVKRIVIASSDKAYGDCAVAPCTEDMPLNGRHPYDVSKSCADAIAQAYYRTYQLPVAIARCGNVYGGADLNWSRLVPGLIRSLLNDERPVIRSDGTYVRDYIYVQDVTRAYRLLAEGLDQERVQGQAFNFSTGQATSVLELLKVIQGLMGREHIEPQVLGCAQAEIRSQVLSNAKARAVLGWQPLYDLEAGLKATIDWYSQYLLE